MSRTKLVIDYQKLQEEIDEVEKETFSNYSSLCAAISELDSRLMVNGTGCTRTAKHVPKTIHPSQVYIAISTEKVKCKTVPGKRGKVAGQSRTSKADKFANNPAIMESFGVISKEVPDKYKNLLEQAKKGSIKSMCKIKCLMCTGFSGMHKGCDSKGCALYPMNLLFWPNRAKDESFIYNPVDKLLGKK